MSEGWILFSVIAFVALVSVIVGFLVLEAVVFRPKDRKPHKWPDHAQRERERMESLRGDDQWPRF